MISRYGRIKNEKLREKMHNEEDARYLESKIVQWDKSVMLDIWEQVTLQGYGEKPQKLSSGMM